LDNLKQERKTFEEFSRLSVEILKRKTIFSSEKIFPIKLEEYQQSSPFKILQDTVLKLEKTC